MDYFLSHIYLPYSLFRLVWLVSGVHDFYIFLYIYGDIYVMVTTLRVCTIID